MKSIYSFVVDGDRRFTNQAGIFLKTLTAVGVRPCSIIAQVTPRATQDARDLIDSFDVTQISLECVLDGAYCNKIGQLSALLDLDADFVVLCDTDLAFLDDISGLFDPRSIRAKPVDLPNPPIDILDTIRLALGITSEPRLVPTDCDPYTQTYSTNCNGGLYIIPRRFLAPLARHWFAETQAIRNKIDLLKTWTMHSDQVGFAMTMLRLGLDIEPIPRDYNFPLHLSRRFRPLAVSIPKVLHYHHLIDGNGFIERVGNSVIDEAVDAVNLILGRG